MNGLTALIACAIALAPAAAMADCSYLWNDRAAQMECQLREARQVQEDLESAARGRRLFDSFPANERSSLPDWMINSREQDARRHLDDALRR